MGTRRHPDQDINADFDEHAVVSTGREDEAAGVKAVIVSLQRGLTQMGRGAHGGGAGAAQSAAWFRLPGLRLARGTRRPQAGRVLRERRQGRRRGGDQTDRHPGVLRTSFGGRTGRQTRVLAVSAGPAHPSDGAAPRRQPLPPDQLGRVLPADRRAPQCAGLPRRSAVLHVGPHQQRGRVPLPAAGAQLRHQQPAGLLEHVPRVVGHRAGRLHRHRQGLGDGAGRRARRLHPDRRAEPRHQPSAHALGAGEGQGQRRDRSSPSTRCPRPA